MALTNRERQDRWRERAKYARQIAGLMVGSLDDPSGSGKAPHPGKILRRLIDDGLNKDYQEIAPYLGITRQRLYNIVDGRTAISPEIALRLGKLCGVSPEIWLRWQARYDLQQVARQLAAEIDRVPQLMSEHFARRNLPLLGADAL
jgi:addiction module HigA family antidote